MGIDQTSPSFPTKWLLWQHDRLMRTPLEGVHAAPLESNIFEWHGNFYFPQDHKFYPNMVAHFILKLPFNFPNATPDMTLLTSFPHSHVFGSDICFSLLKAFEEEFEGLPDTVFWNPSRSIRSLLESVYIFLTVDEDRWRNYDKSCIRAAMRSAQQCHCLDCGHCPSTGNIWPPEEHWMAGLVAATGSSNEEKVCAAAMHDDLVAVSAAKKKPVKPKAPPEARLPTRQVVVEINELTTVSLVCSLPPKPSLAPSFEEMAAILKAQADETVSVTSPQGTSLGTETLEDFRCSMSGVAFGYSEKLILGFGVDVQRRYDGSIEAITTDLTPISMEIFFKGRIRRSALGANVTHFFPFAVNKAHWERAKRVLPGCVNAILGDGPDTASLASPEEKLLFVVGELWKSLAVLMMKGETHASEKVLKGFCSLHHLLLMATEEQDPLLDSNSLLVQVAEKSGQSKAEEDGEEEDGWKVIVPKKRIIHNGKESASRSPLLNAANLRVQGFAKFPRLRHKAQCPDFGRFLPMILLSDVSWEEIRQPLLSQLLTRNARWIVKTDARLGVVRPMEVSQISGRVEKSWPASATGLKLTAFQIRFFLSVVAWARDTLPPEIVGAYERMKSPQLMVRAMYNILGGRPTQDMLSLFQAETKEIESMGGFAEVFEKMDLPATELEIQAMLCEAMANSARFKYHRL